MRHNEFSLRNRVESTYNFQCNILDEVFNRIERTGVRYPGPVHRIWDKLGIGIENPGPNELRDANRDGLRSFFTEL